MANVLGGMVTCETVLTSMCGCGNVEIWLTCSGNSVGSNITMDLGPWCRCNWLEENQLITITKLWEKPNPKITDQSKCSQMMNCCWNFLGNSRVHVVIPIGWRLFPSAPFTLYIFVCTNVGLGCSLSKHALDTHEIAAPVSNRYIVLFLLIVTGELMAYFMLLNLTSIISSVHDSHSESDEGPKLLYGLSKYWSP